MGGGILILMGARWFELFHSNLLIGLCIIGIVVLSVQYPLLLLTKNWFVRFLIFMLGMILGLFLYGMFLSYDSRVSHSFTQMLSGCVLVMIFGGLFGFLPYGGIVLMNWWLQDYFYPKHKS